MGDYSREAAFWLLLPFAECIDSEEEGELLPKVESKIFEAQRNTYIYTYTYIHIYLYIHVYIYMYI